MEDDDDGGVGVGGEMLSSLGVLNASWRFRLPLFLDLELGTLSDGIGDFFFRFRETDMRTDDQRCAGKIDLRASLFPHTS